MNPYAAHLAGRAPLEVMKALPGELQRIFSELGAEGAEQSTAPGKWSAREILCHLADCEIVFAFRLRQALAEDRHVIQPFDQDRWAEMSGAYSVTDALAVFSSVRRWNITLLQTAGDGAGSRTLNHPERGDMTFQTLIETIGGHDLNHLGQLQKITAAHPST